MAPQPPPTPSYPHKHSIPQPQPNRRQQRQRRKQNPQPHRRPRLQRQGPSRRQHARVLHRPAKINRRAQRPHLKMRRLRLHRKIQLLSLQINRPAPQNIRLLTRHQKRLGIHNTILQRKIRNNALYLRLAGYPQRRKRRIPHLQARQIHQ